MMTIEYTKDFRYKALSFMLAQMIAPEKRRNETQMLEYIQSELDEIAAQVARDQAPPAPMPVAEVPADAEPEQEKVGRVAQFLRTMREKAGAA